MSGAVHSSRAGATPCAGGAQHARRRRAIAGGGSRVFERADAADECARSGAAERAAIGPRLRSQQLIRCPHVRCPRERRPQIDDDRCAAAARERCDAVLSRDGVRGRVPMSCCRAPQRHRAVEHSYRWHTAPARHGVKLTATENANGGHWRRKDKYSDVRFAATIHNTNTRCAVCVRRQVLTNLVHVEHGRSTPAGVPPSTRSELTRESLGKRCRLCRGKRKRDFCLGWR